MRGWALGVRGGGGGVVRGGGGGERRGGALLGRGNRGDAGDRE